MEVSFLESKIDQRLQLAFVSLIIVGTTSDAILRQFFPAFGQELSAFYVATLLGAFWLFAKMAPEPLVFPRLNLKKRDKRDLLSSLWNIQDPLLIVRFFAAFLVFSQHANILLQPNKQIFSGNYIFLQGNAHAGMAIFFTLSGYLMGKAFLYGRYQLTKNGILVYYVSRWIRIFPLMCFIFLFFCIFLYPDVLHSSDALRVLGFSYYSDILPYDGISAMWSLSIEFQYYLIAPFLFSIFNEQITRNRKRGIAVLMAVIAVTYLSVKYTLRYYSLGLNLHDPNYFSLLGNLPFFLTGLLFNYIRPTIPARAGRLIFNDWTLLCLLILFFMWTGHLRAPSTWKISIGTGVVISLLDGLRDLPIRARPQTLRLFEMLGALSYGFYLWHSGIGHIYVQIFPDRPQSLASYFLSAAIIGCLTLAISLGTYVLIEDRFNFYKPVNRAQAPP